MVKKNNIVDTTLEEARSWGNAQYLEDGLVLTDRIAYAPIPKEPTRMTFILMALCRKGQAQYSIDTREQIVQPGDLLFISEGHIVDNYSASPDFECSCILVSTQFYHSFVQNVKNVSSLLLFSMNNPVVRLTPREIQTYSNYFQTIRDKIADTQHHYRIELVKALLLAMFYDMSGVIYRVEQSSCKGQSRADVMFAKFIRLLEENFRKERRVGWYANKMGITAKYLSEIVKNVSKRIGGNSTRTIGQITEDLNFPNQSFLGKFFKEHVGVSPTEYRKS